MKKTVVVYKPEGDPVRIICTSHEAVDRVKAEAVKAGETYSVSKGKSNGSGSAERKTKGFRRPLTPAMRC